MIQNHRAAWDDSEIARLISVARTGSNTKTVAYRMGRTPRAIVVIAKLHNIKLGKQQKWSAAEINQLTDLAKAGLTDKEIVAIFTSRRPSSVRAKLYGLRKTGSLPERSS